MDAPPPSHMTDISRFLQTWRENIVEKTSSIANIEYTLQQQEMSTVTAATAMSNASTTPANTNTMVRTLSQLVKRISALSFAKTGLAIHESAMIAWVVIVAIRRMYKALMATRKNALSSTSDSVEEITAKVRGRKFAQTEGSDNETEIDLSLLGTIPYYLPAGLVALRHLSLVAGKDVMPHSHQVARAYVGVFGLLPLIDMMVPNDWTNPTKEQQTSIENRFMFRLPLYAWTVMELFTTLSSYKLAMDAGSKLSTGSKVSIMLMQALFNGAFGITCSHELIHKRPMFEQVLGYWLLCNVNYMHWGEEHVTGHHENVATENDPATAKYGENLYSFIPRCIAGTISHSIELETQRLRESGYEGNPWMTLRNRTYWWMGIPFAWSLFLYRFTNNWKSIPVFYGTGILSASLLEMVNFVEHWGLERKKLDDGTFEPVDPTHSWNAPNRISNAALWKLQRHSDHHTFASRPYHLLRNFKESPQLPTGYPGMLSLAFVPPMFNHIMMPLTDAYKNRTKYLTMIDKDPENETAIMEFKQAQAACEKAENVAKAQTFAYGVTFLGVTVVLARKMVPALESL